MVLLAPAALLAGLAVGNVLAAGDRVIDRRRYAWGFRDSARIRIAASTAPSGVHPGDTVRPHASPSS